MAGTPQPTEEPAQVFLCAQCSKAPAADGSDLCALHWEAKKERQAAWALGRYHRLRKKKLCGKCGKVPSKTPYCKACLRRMGRVASARDLDTDLDKRARIAAATRAHEDGRTRYHGQKKRGNQPHAQLDAQDRESAQRQIAAGFARLEAYRGPEVQALPRIQRESVKRQALQEIDHGSRFLEDVLERNGHFNDAPAMVRTNGKRRP